MSTSPPVRPFTDAYLLSYSTEHVQYEFDMFLWSVEMCSRRGTTIGASSQQHLTRLKNILVESSVIHLRNLIDFFYLPSPQPTDIIAADFFSSPSHWVSVRPLISAALDKARVRANKEIAHLTTDRLAGAPPEKYWDVLAIAGEIRPLMNLLVQHADGKRLSASVAAVIR